MTFSPIIEAYQSDRLNKIHLLATDMDGTLTQKEKFTANLLQTLEDLAKAEIDVLIVTGRSAGWVDGIASYLPVSGAIAENGGLFYSSRSEAPELLVPIADVMLHRQHLAAMFAELQFFYPNLQESADNRFRITDWTFDVKGLSEEALQHMTVLCQEKGWSFTYSTVQCHIKPLQQDKAIALEKVLTNYFPQIAPNNLVTIGDSPNDESLFNRDRYPLSVGVANILHYSERLKHRPTYVTKASEGEGFSEIARLVIQATRH
ncbi:HAD family phosphatase [Candidatus Gracilibacteria bacterium]|nr:HAD family phosphatase [Candidatus Gracilibacteria bacterium]NJQ98001.1 HAD family phosphatase [Hydrococcus sp. CSU_1_8]